MFTEPERPWGLTRRSLDRLLQRLAEQPEAAAQEYEAIRRRLITFFSLRRAHPPESLADETIDRVARKLEEGETIEHVRAYFHGVAQRVALECERRQRREWQVLKDNRELLALEQPDATLDDESTCLDGCLQKLPRASRVLIVAYYASGRLSYRESRKLLARRLGISYSALKVRAHRIRAQLETCMKDCLDGQKGTPPSLKGRSDG